MTARTRTVLALDLGTSCGWAIARVGDPLLRKGGEVRRLGSGTWDLSPGRSGPEAHVAWRYARLRDYLEAALDAAPGVTHLAWEQVVGRPARSGVEAGHVYGGLRTVLHLVAWDRGLPLVGVSVQAVKRLAAGRGNADKAEVTRSAQRELGILVGPDEADAWFVARAALELLDKPPGLEADVPRRRAERGSGRVRSGRTGQD